MPSKQSLPPKLQTLLTGLAFGESPRWHEDRLWFSNWGMQEIVAVDGRLLVTSGRDGRLQRREPDGSLVTHADLTGL